MAETSFHIHANHFRAEPPASLGALENLGFRAQKADIIEGDRHLPLWLISKVEVPQAIRHDLLERVLNIIRADEAYEGYVESEALPLSWTSSRVDQIYKACKGFPIPQNLKLVQGEKRADIHIFRSAETPRDQLDEALKLRGFYEVRTERSRIWTLLMGSGKDATLLREKLIEYFSRAGGVKKVECEIVTSLHAFPGDFEMRPVVPSGTFT